MKKFGSPGLIAIALLLAVTLAVISGCGGSKSNSGNDSRGKAVTAETVGVAIYPGTVPEEAYPGVYKMATEDAFDRVVAFYKAELPGATFSEITIPSGRGASFVVDKGDFHGNVSIEENVPESGRVTITVSRSTAK